jgi:hypothetical protein
VTARAPHAGRHDRVICCRHFHDRARPTLRGTDEQVRQLQGGTGQRNQINRLTGGARSVSRKRELEARAKALAGLKGYIMDLRAFSNDTPVTAGFVIGAYHRLFEIEGHSR